MKKKSAFVALAVAAVVTLASCGGNSKSFNATYFAANPSGSEIKTVNETLNYRVYSFAEKDEKYENDKYLPKIASAASGLKFNVDENTSSYETTLKTNDDKSGYIFTSTLIVNGEYTYGDGKTFKVENDKTEIKATFNGIDGKFEPVEVEKTVTNVFPSTMSPSKDEDFVKVGYTYKITYGKTAKITFTAADDEQSKNYFSAQTDKETEIKNYNKSDFVENDLLFTVFRNFDYSVGFSYKYSTIDGVSKSLVSATASAYTENNAATSLKLLTFKKNNAVALNGRTVTEFNANGVKFSTNGEYAKAYAYCYYAASVHTSDETVEDGDNSTRRVPLLIAQPMIHNTGYLVLSLKNTNF